MEGKNQLISFVPLFLIVFFSCVAVFIFSEEFSFSKIFEPYKDTMSLLLAFLSIVDMLLIYFVLLPKFMHGGQQHIILLLSDMPVIFGIVVCFMNQNGWAILPFSFLAFAQYFLIYQKINESF